MTIARSRSDARTSLSLLTLVFFVFGFACIGPAASDQVGYSAHVLDEGARVPALADDALLGPKVSANDGVDGPLLLQRTGYANGEEMQYWEIGTAAPSPKAAWVFRRNEKDGSSREVDHPPLIDSIPGDTSYTPLRLLHVVYVTDAYRGERITSAEALEDAIELGLVEEPIATKSYAVWPVVAPGVQLDRGTDAPLSASRVYYRGRIAHYLKLGEGQDEVLAHDSGRTFTLGMGPLSTPNVYVLRRQNETRALDEPARKTDLNGDGDMLDTSTVFSASAADEAYSALWKQVEVVVPADYAFRTARAESDLFLMTGMGQAATELVVEHAEAAQLFVRVLDEVER